ncbi:LacI family transcriptional regulator [Vibrio sp. MACH09]|uniref:LacI family DNA-binding transcriptional regulator n=1 Tax=unclassified Vibrio TaxID=2614977 RepID=UPI001493B1F8|nr:MULTISPECIES: LacI family DNA-binding transcriptional regulator [unclassified Vibrio]NOI66872.1 substrate-binding domain-containing protein [Vibrio sp. 99-8-1]GLO62950.1 LacI family transcriptional regulator [Vibrio sp. MACH09]
MKSHTVKKPTLKDVAKQLGVSTATVSNAFNRPDQLSASLKTKILEQCQQLGYTGPSLTARSLRTGKTGVIGVLLADNLSYSFTDPVASEFLAGISETLDEQHVNMLLLPSNTENYQSTQAETIPDSFIVYGKPADRHVLERLQQQGKPLVTVDFDLPKTPSVSIDNEKSAYLIASNVLNHAEQKLLILGLRLEPSNALSFSSFDKLFTPEECISRRRLEGYKKAMKEVGIELETHHVWQIHHLEHDAMKAVLRGALTAPDNIDVLLCMSDRIALAALDAAKELSIEVPQQLKIVGFDDIPQAERAGLSTVHQPIAEKGRIAAKIALGILPYESVELAEKIQLRQSS